MLKTFTQSTMNCDFTKSHLPSSVIFTRRLSLLAAPSVLAACGGGGSGVLSTSNPDDGLQPSLGLPNSYTPPSSTYTAPSTADPNRFALRTEFLDPYWVASLRNGSFDQIEAFIDGFDRTYAYAFPDTMPAYYQGVVVDGTAIEAGWRSANTEMQAAHRDIFGRLEAVLDISFVETSELDAFNLIAISQNDQGTTTAGYAFYPSDQTLLGSDILISTLYASPVQNPDGSTNFDYEVLIHELGHALGLKHPFESDGGNTTTLNATEDTTVWTAMSYDALPSSFDGELRAFDLMALTEVYGVNPTYRAGDDIYSFSSGQGVFVVDGAGTDAISAAGRLQDVTIDLRAGAQSYVGATSKLISEANQLAISPNTKIENAIGGMGDDFLIGNDLDNLLLGSGGSDRIFAGEGADTVIGGAGDDSIDLFELVSARDTVVFDLTNPFLGSDIIFGFEQGRGGDVIDFAGNTFQNLLEVVSSSNVPDAFVHGYILRLTDAILDTSDKLVDAFADGGAFEALDFAFGGEAIVIAAESQATGEDQLLYHVEKTETGLEAAQFATLAGNYLDLDSWQSSNFVM